MKYDLIIIGSGPAGYVAAIRAGQIGLKTAIVEKEKIGGMCLNWGCIPTKSIIESAKYYDSVKNSKEFGIGGIDLKKLTFDWNQVKKRSERIVLRLTKGVEFLLKKNGVDVIKGTATIQSEKAVVVDKQLLETESIILATGSKPKSIEGIKSSSIQDLLDSGKLPENPVIIGCNPHAVELAQFFNLVGANITLLASQKTLIPDADKYLSDFILSKLKKSKINVDFDIELKSYKNGLLKTNKSEIKTDMLVNASERTATIPESNVNFELNDDFIQVNEFLQTSIENIFAIGDVNGTSKFAHTASAQGLHVINYISGIKKAFDRTKFPINIYTYPEMAQIGLTENEVKTEGYEYKISEFPLSANGKAMIEGQRDGTVRMISEKKYGEVLGVQIIANNATDLIAEAGVLMQLEGTVYDVANTIHAHPTISEIYMESGFDAFDQPIHK